MQKQANKNKLLSIFLWTLLFTLAYSQSPLYTSNQNQYFLHGLAKAGLGSLSEDWLANTLDPTPVFSGLVYLTYRLLAWPPLFYLFFGILAGVYLFSLLGIADQLFGITQHRLTRRVYLTLFIGLNAAVLRFVLVRTLGTNWAYLFDGGVAGQRLLGAVLQPSTFGVFLLLSIYLFLRGRYFWALVPLLIAPTVHPTYLLSAGVLTAVYLGIVFIHEKKLCQPVIMGGIALIGILPILLHVLIVFAPTGPYYIARARELLVDFRIPHHTQPALWWDAASAIKIAMILWALYLARTSRLFGVMLGSFLVAGTLTLAQVITKNHALALLFPWRISTFLVPLALSVILAWVVQWGFYRFDGFTAQQERPITYAVFTVAILLAVAGGGIFAVNLQDRAESPDRAMMAYTLSNRAPGQNYVIPLHMQDFRLETGIPAYVEFKSIPYNDVDILEWYRRVSLAGRLYQATMQRYGCEALTELSSEGVTHVVLPYDHAAKNCPMLDRQYIDFSYEVFELVP